MTSDSTERYPVLVALPIRVRPTDYRVTVLKSNVILYHADCLDGFGAAYAAWLVFGETATYLPYAYGMAAPDVTGKSVFIADFSFSTKEMEVMKSQAKRVVLLDHHQSAIDALTSYQCGCAKSKMLKFGYSENETLVPSSIDEFTDHIDLDVSKSGARLAWEYFHGKYDVPEMIKYIEDRDLWVWKFGKNTRHFMASLDALPKDFAVWDGVRNMSPKQQQVFMDEGKSMCRMFDALVASLAREARPLELNGIPGLMVNSSREFASDVGQFLSEKSGTFGVVWLVERDNSIKVSIRTVKQNECDIRAIAEAFGGGGHPLASAFRLPMSRFAELMTGSLTSKKKRAIA